MKKPVVLRIYKGDQLLGVKQFTDAQIVIGRPGEVQVALDGDGVSLIHAAIEEREGSYSICDLGSEGGTFKNGEKVLDAPLESGDIVQVGDFRVEFYIGVPKPKTAPPTNPYIPVPQDAAPALTVAPASVETPPAPVEAAPAQQPVVEATQPTIVTPQQAAVAETPEPAPKIEPVAAPAPQVVAQPVAPPAAPKAEPKPSIPDVPRPEAAKVQAPKPKTSETVTNPSFAVGKAPVQPTRTTGDVAVASAGLAGPAMSAGTLPSKRPAPKHANKHKKGKKTFAPPSRHSNIKDFVKPTKGTIVEVLVAWRERIIATYHFSQKKVVTMGSKPDCDIVLPAFASKARKIPLLKIETSATVLVTPEMTGELIRGQASSPFLELVRQNRMIKVGASYGINLEQGEMVRIDCGEQISVIIRYVSEAPKPMVAPLLDFTTSEFTGVVLALAIAMSFWLYMFLYQSPKGLPSDEMEEPARVAVIITPPTPPPVVPPAPPAPVEPEEPKPTPPPVVTRATPSPVKVETKTAAPTQATSTNLTKKNDPGKSANAAPNKNKTGPRTLTSPKQGGEIKTTDKPSAQAKSVNKNVEKSGIFSVFGGGGANDQLAQHTSGSGELVGMADAASGKAGMAENRAGQGLGSAVKDTGIGGTGAAQVGINGGVGTAGRGSGNSGYGVGGLGSKAGVKIVTGGGGEKIEGTIDREAIRRVIMANLRTIRTCYERQLNRNPDLSGKLVLSWDIGENGRVVGTRVKSNELGNADVATCILDRLKTWTFPEPPANQVVEVEAYPFFFSN